MTLRKEMTKLWLLKLSKLDESQNIPSMKKNPFKRKIIYS